MIYSDQFEKFLKPKIFVIRILWFSLTIPILFYIFIAYFVSFRTDYLDSKSLEITLKYVFYGAGLIIIVLSLMIKKILFSNKKIIAQLKKEVNPEDLAINPETKEIDQDKLERLSQLSEQELKLISLANWYTVRFIMQMSICEAIPILGLLLSFITYRPSEILPFAIVSFILCLAFYNGLNSVIEKGSKILEDPIMYTS